MATYEEIYKLRVSGNTASISNRCQVAVAKAAYDIMNEDVGTANHANRIIWAKSALADPGPKATEMIWQVLSNATIASSGENSTDNDIQFVINGLINNFATG